MTSEKPLSQRIVDRLMKLQEADDLATPADMVVEVEALLQAERDASTAWIQSIREPHAPDLYLVDRLGNSWMIPQRGKLAS